MSPGDLFLLQTYGPWLLIAILLFREVWPFLRESIFPAFIKRNELQDERKATLEERQVRAFEKIAENTQKLTILYATIEDRTGRTYDAVTDVQSVLIAHDARSQLRDATIPIKTKPLGNNNPRGRLQS